MAEQSSSRATIELGATFDDIRQPLRALCAGFPGEYWRALDREREYPTAFVEALTEAEQARMMEESDL